MGCRLFTQILYPIITLILGAILGSWITVFVARPKLKIAGSSSGGNGINGHRNTLRIMNRPGLMGIAAGPTIILGKRISRGFEKGITVARATANECTASLYDKETGQAVSLLYWLLMSDQPRMLPTVDIKSGETVELVLFARQGNEPLKYFVYKPAGPSQEALVPPDEVKFTESRRFTVRILYSYGRQKLEFDVGMRKGFDGILYFEWKDGSSSF
jgi:hypothetical protein